MFRAARATRMPSREKRRAREALRPAPTPTISAVSYRGEAIDLSFDPVMAASRSFPSEDSAVGRVARGATLAHPLGLMKDDVLEAALDHSRAGAPLLSAMRARHRPPETVMTLPVK